MSLEHEQLILDERTQRAVDELEATITEHYPTATFELSRGQDDPSSLHLTTTVDLDDAFEVLDKVLDRIVDLQVEDGIPLHVIPVRTAERIAAAQAAEQSAKRPRVIRRTPLLGRLPTT